MSTILPPSDRPSNRPLSNRPLSKPPRLDTPTKISFGVLGLAFCFVMWVFWSLLWPFNPLEMHPGSWTTTKQEYHRGDWVEARLDYCQTIAGTPRLDFTIEQGGRLIPLVPTYGNDRAFCEKKDAPILQLPYNALLDQQPVKILVTITFQVNPLREIQYHFETNSFTVVD